MAFNINEFISNGLPLGGARPSLFRVTMGVPPGIRGIVPDSIAKLVFTCRATSAPASKIGAVNVGYFGRDIKLAGDRTFDDWNATVMLDEDFVTRDLFEAWHNSINSIVGNIKLTPGNTYKGTATIEQFSKSGNVIKAYNIINMFPNDVGDMRLDWDLTNQIQTFDVRFSYDYFEPVVLNNGTLIDINASA
jgi:hypothetical protein